MRNFEPTLVLRLDGFRTGCWGSRVRKTVGGTESCRAPRRERGGSRLELFRIGQEGRVDNVNTFGFGLGRTSVGLGRIDYVFWSSVYLRGLECGSSPTSGTVDPLVRGVFAFNVCTKLVVASL